MKIQVYVNASGPEQNGWHLAGDTLRCIFIQREGIWIRLHYHNINSSEIYDGPIPIGVAQSCRFGSPAHHRQKMGTAAYPSSNAKLWISTDAWDTDIKAVKIRFYPVNAMIEDILTVLKS